MKQEMKDRKHNILKSIHSSSWGISMIALTVVAVLEIFMIGFSIANAEFYGPYLGIYRSFYIFLLLAALIYIALNFYIKMDIENRQKLLNVLNPVYAVLFFAWSLGIIYYDASITGNFDPAVFMTFSLIIPLSFFLFPSVYALIVVLADAILLYIAIWATGTSAPLINLVFFFIFQFILGISFLRIKIRLAERILIEEENAKIDVLTGLPNRRFYENDLKEQTEEGLKVDLIYMAIDLNGLKETNDHYGHETGDKIIVGAARCIEECFAKKGKVYRIGGDEFAVILHGNKQEMEEMIASFEESMKKWSEENGVSLSASYGYVCLKEHPELNITELAKEADNRMYEAKAEYYSTDDRNRRKYIS